jgi:hypothetical protein
VYGPPGWLKMNKVTNISFMTSCSNNFQKRITNKTIHETKEELENIFDVLKNREHKDIKKKRCSEFSNYKEKEKS